MRLPDTEPYEGRIVELLDTRRPLGYRVDLCCGDVHGLLPEGQFAGIPTPVGHH